MRESKAKPMNPNRSANDCCYTCAEPVSLRRVAMLDGGEMVPNAIVVCMNCGGINVVDEDCKSLRKPHFAELCEALSSSDVERLRDLVKLKHAAERKVKRD